ncbi:GspH/FimT family pseudopilin [Azohydromonas aeria]|uniref:GspH/FimT family pseudopilin n=1 Tax=Azohydromonas aeria TaxID=2590212 RepID=UPI0018DF66E7|nr:GspH/FimT family protein [Azohydromonas aeria]
MPAARLRSSRPRRHPRPAPRGLSLVESLAVLAVLAIAAGVALPNFSALAERQQLQTAAARFEDDVRFAQDSAVLRAQSVRLSFHDDADAPRCWLVHTGEIAQCRCDAANGTAACDAPAQLLRVHTLPAHAPLRLAANGASMRFGAVRRTTTPALTLTLTARSGASVREVVSVMGRVRGCSPGGAVAGFKSC